MFKVLGLVLVLALAVNAAQQQQSRLRKLSAYGQGGYGGQQQENNLMPELQFKQQFQQQRQPQLPQLMQFGSQFQQQPQPEFGRQQQQQQPMIGGGVQLQQPIMGGQFQQQQQQPELIRESFRGQQQQQPIGGQFQQQLPEMQQPQQQQESSFINQQQQIVGGGVQQQQPNVGQFQQQLPELQQPQQQQESSFRGQQQQIVGGGVQQPQPELMQQKQQQPELIMQQRETFKLPELVRETPSSSFNSKPTGSSGYQSSFSAPPTRAFPPVPAPAPYQSYQPSGPPTRVITTQTYGSSYGGSTGGLTDSAITPLGNSPCIGHEAGDKLVHPTSTRLFIVCQEEGRFAIMQCAPSTWFNINTLKCENTLKVPKGCASNPCLNGGKCFDLPLFTFRCECLPGSAGDFCDKTDACLGPVNPCGADNICVPLPFGSIVDKYCLCDDGNKIGLDCVSNVEKNPCLDNQLDIWNVDSKINVKSAYIHCEGHIPFFKLCPAVLELNVEKQQCDWPAELFQNVQEQQFGGAGYGQQQQVFLKPQITQQAYGGYGQQVIEKPKVTQEYGGYQQQPQKFVNIQSGGYGQHTVMIKPPRQATGYGY